MLKIGASVDCGTRCLGSCSLVATTKPLLGRGWGPHIPQTIRIKDKNEEAFII